MSQAPPKATFVTFYSFKGGVGRSMALINTAAMLAGRGLGVVRKGFRVLVLDLDLEAPGLSYLVNGEPSGTPPTGSPTGAAPLQPGFVDLLGDAKERGAEGDLFALPAAEIVRRYTRPYRFPDRPGESVEGDLHIMPAGRFDGEYARRFDALDLRQLYQDGLGEPLIRVFKTKFAEAGLYDYVLVDSRTGFSDEAGICTRDLADFLIILSGLNRQNVEGTCNFLRALRTATGGKKPIRIVLSPVPTGEDALLDEREAQAKAAFELAWGTEVDLSLQIPYHPKLALTEEPHISRRRRGALFEAYSGITRHMLSAIGHDTPSLTLTIEDTLRKKDYASTLFSLEILVRLEDGPLAVASIAGELATRDSTDRLNKAEAKPSEPPDALETILRDDHGRRVLELLIAHLPIDEVEWTVSRFLERLDATLPGPVDAFFDRLAREAAEAESLLGNHAVGLEVRWNSHDRAESYYRRAIAAGPRNEINLVNYADFLDKRGEFDAAREYYDRAVEVGPGNAFILASYATFLEKRGESDAARAHYNRAIDLNPNNASILVNYADFLEKRGELDAARDCYERAVGVDPGNSNALAYYAYFLQTRGEFDRAREQFEGAVAVGPDNDITLGLYAVFLEDRGEFDAARAYYERSVAAGTDNANIPGNFGQFLAGQGQYERGREWLLEALKRVGRSETNTLAEICLSLWIVTSTLASDSDRWERGFKFAVQRGFERRPWRFDGMLRQAESRLTPEEFAYARAMAAAFLDATRMGDLEAFDRWCKLEPLDPTTEKATK